MNIFDSHLFHKELLLTVKSALRHPDCQIAISSIDYFHPKVKSAIVDYLLSKEYAKYVYGNHALALDRDKANTLEIVLEEVIKSNTDHNFEKWLFRIVSLASLAISIIALCK